MTRISSLAVGYARAAQKKKMRTAVFSGLVAAVFIVYVVLTNGADSAIEAGDSASNSGSDQAAASAIAGSISVTSDGGDATTSSQKAQAAPPKFQGALRGASVERSDAQTARDFDADAAGEDHETAEYPDDEVGDDDQEEREDGDDYVDDMMGGRGDRGDDDDMMLDSPDGAPPEGMMDDDAGQAESDGGEDGAEQEV